jgi:hypothetical protein
MRDLENPRGRSGEQDRVTTCEAGVMVLIPMPAFS